MMKNMSAYRLTVLAPIILLTGIAAAMPPHPDILAKIEQGEIREPFANEHFYGLPAAYKINAPSPRNSAAITGTFRALCILVDFADEMAAANAFEFDTLVFGTGSGTVRHYYQEVSYGQLDIVAVDLPSDLGWQRAPQTYSYYVDDEYGIGAYPNNCQKLCEDLVDLVDATVDFSDYDNNGDGWADVIMIAHAGPGAEKTGSTADIWSHKWGITARFRDGVYISDYTIMPEYWTSPGDMTIGVYCHELGHVFGLPDLYDTEQPPSGTASQGIGHWSLMASGSWNGSNGSSPAHLDAWCKKEVGWVTPTNITTNQTGVSIANAENNAVAFRLWTSGAASNEFFLVENRQQLGYDTYLPYHGLLIWHIDESVGTDNDDEWYPGHTSDGHYLVALEQADDLWEMEMNLSNGNGGDPYPGNTATTAFTPTSSPGSDDYDGSGTNVAVTNISASASVMTADFTVSLSSGTGDEGDGALPQLELKQNYPNPFNPLTRIDYSLDTAGEAVLAIFNVLGQKVNQIVSGHHLAGQYTVEWDGTDLEGRPLASGIYFYELITNQNSLVRKMVMIK